MLKPIKARAEPRSKPPPAAKGTKGAGKDRPRRRWRWGRLLLILLAVAVLLPPLEVGFVRYFDPPVTPLMGLRWLGDQFSAGGQPRVLYRWQDWEELPPSFLKAVWIGEDQRFFKHHGFDWVEMSRSLERAEKTGQDPRGSSTITMQCARSLFLWQGRSYVRKGLEAYYTVLMEAFLSKRRIFELYANVIEMGPGVYGVDAASRYHYGVESRRLSTEQAVMLAALLPAPRTWNPRAPSKKLQTRETRIMRDYVAVKWPGA